MDRLAARLALPALVAGALAAAPAGAQTLQSLHVRSFDISADRTSLRVGEPFHLTLAAHVAEPISELDDVTLPDLAGFDVLGDERRCASSGSGTDCTESLTLAPNAPGDRTLGPVTMDAVDARNRKPSRFATNTVLVHVAGAAPAGAAAVALGLLRALLAFALIAVAVVALFWGFRRTRGPVRAAPAALPVAPPPPDPDARLRALVAELEREPVRARVVAVRDALRARIGAREGETLRDLLARGAGDGAYSATALAALERAAFCEDAHVLAAIGEALPYLRN